MCTWWTLNSFYSAESECRETTPQESVGGMFVVLASQSHRMKNINQITRLNKNNFVNVCCHMSCLITVCKHLFASFSSLRQSLFNTMAHHRPWLMNPISECTVWLQQVYTVSLIGFIWNLWFIHKNKLCFQLSDVMWLHLFNLPHFFCFTTTALKTLWSSSWLMQVFHISSACFSLF